MTTDPAPDPSARADLERLRAAIENKTHWTFLTDDLPAALVLRQAAPGDALLFETAMHLTDRGEAFPLVVLAVSKTEWPPSAALRVATAATAGRGPVPDEEQVKDGMDTFTISPNPERLALVWELIRRGAVFTEPPAPGRK